MPESGNSGFSQLKVISAKKKKVDAFATTRSERFPNAFFHVLSVLVFPSSPDRPFFSSPSWDASQLFFSLSSVLSGLRNVGIHTQNNSKAKKKFSPPPSLAAAAVAAAAAPSIRVAALEDKVESASDRLHYLW